MIKTLRVKHTVDRHGQPLLEIDNLGQVAELSPAAARRYMVARNDYNWGQP
ncbi:MAG: hypothetical protein FWF20_07050 [Betaproteobacteria bacterium]|nr:hypothetical protein [Betaproteobacteria bacterium]MCL2886526.1 hypothetical protein [Betaproteobacteria bacterium]